MENKIYVWIAFLPKLKRTNVWLPFISSFAFQYIPTTNYMCFFYAVQLEFLLRVNKLKIRVYLLIIKWKQHPILFLHHLMGYLFFLLQFSSWQIVLPFPIGHLVECLRLSWSLQWQFCLRYHCNWCTSESS